MQSLIHQHFNQQIHLAEFSQIDFGLAVPVFKQGDNPIDAINKMMSFLSTVVTSRETKFLCCWTSRTRVNTSGTRGNYLGQQRIMKCFNCQWEGHMARQCLKPKRKRDATWFREKFLLVKAQGNGKVLNEKELEFLADLSIAKEHPENEIHSDSNIIPYSQYLTESQTAAVQDTNSSAQQDAMILSVFEQLSEQVTNCNKVNKDNLMANESLSAELKRYKERVKFLKERQNVDLSTREELIIDDIIKEKNA
nr:Gag-Pol polyprotein [Tanacetum cinerariifolium]